MGTRAAQHLLPASSTQSSRIHSPHIPHANDSNALALFHNGCRSQVGEVLFQNQGMVDEDGEMVKEKVLRKLGGCDAKPLNSGKRAPAPHNILQIPKVRLPSTTSRTASPRSNNPTKCLPRRRSSAVRRRTSSSDPRSVRASSFSALPACEYLFFLPLPHVLTNDSFASFNDTFVHITDLSGRETISRVTGMAHFQGKH